MQQTQEEPIGESFHKFTPQGVSGLVLGNGAHVCIHTWPEHGYAAIDVFTCGEAIEPRQSVALFIEKLGSTDSSFVEIKRGVLQETNIGCGV